MLKSALFILILCLASLIVSAQTNAQSPELAEAEQLSAQVVRLYQAGKFAAALPLAERALALREKTLGAEHELVAAALRNLAEVQLARSKNREAEAYYDRYLSIYDKVAGEHTDTFIQALERYVCLLVGIERREKALEIQKRLYQADNQFEYDSGNTPVKYPEMAGLMIAKSIKTPRPEYSAEAKQARLSGSVIMKITVDETGKVVAVKVLCGHPLLVTGAETAIRQAQYKPTIVSGQAVRVKGIAIYNFVRL